MKATWDTIVAFKLVWVRVLFFMLAPMIAAFLAINQTVDMDTKWPQMGPFGKWTFWLGIIYTGINSLLAFIDQSLNRAKDELKARRSGETEIISKV